MEINFEIIRGILERRLQQEDIERLLGGLSDAEKTQLLIRITELVRRTTALVDVANRVSDTLSLDVLFPRLMEVVTETLNAERSSLFLHDAETGELFSRVMQGNAIGEVRFPADQGIAGSVFTAGQSEIIADAYADARFNRSVDTETGYRTRNILCVPIRNKALQVIGVTQALNKRDGNFDAEDRRLLEALSSQAAAALENAQMFEKVERSQREEALLLDVVSSITSEIMLEPLLQKILAAATQLLGADRGSLFLHDASSKELWSRVAGGEGSGEIRFPATAGIAGECFTKAVCINIDDAYLDPRFNPDVDKGTGYRTRNILCMPISTRGGNKVGVMEILNKKDGPFTLNDQQRLAALCAQAAVSIENAQLFEDVSNSRNYNEGILRSMSNGVITLNAENIVSKINQSALRILRRSEEETVNRGLDEIFDAPNSWVTNSLEKVARTGRTDSTIDSDLVLDGKTAVSVNMTAVPLRDTRDERIGSMLIIEDITREKRLRNTMSRYMSKAVMDELLEGGDAALNGANREVSVLFSDIRGFTSMSERLGARDTVAMLNDYFTDMVDIVFAHNGILDKYIGDMIMAVFGSVRATRSDAANAVTVGSRMMVALQELNRRRARGGREPIRIGIGISTGDVVAGSIGSPKRLEYTVIGDRVNLAERLQNANKYYGTSILICQTTATRLRSPVRMRELDLIRVRGMQAPVAICEVLDHHTADSFPHADEVIFAFAEAVAHYRNRSWNRASTLFNKILVACPGDRPSQLYRERCEIYSRNPPPENWDGVWTLPVE
ncbi:MAG: GAF domain-containing protein [Betaproteobacteria bacterium]|jgi:adenylate cyclase|nr:GAF domain-containing protein [Betaproteobacteria bacterium]MDH4293670.1 GAF domain-containing protein [Betaproteobacteria bacterium]MDH5342644.1 GAF domain-containing protein [Betaproteobacteria bacterium]